MLKKNKNNKNIDENSIEFWKKIQETKKELKITFKEMSLKANVPVSTLSTAISNLKAGKRVTTGTLKQIEKALGKPIFFGK